MADLKGGARRVRDALAAKGFACEIATFPDGTRTAAEAARAVGCTLAQIAKSLVFRAQVSDRPVLVVTSGANRVDEKKLAALLGEPVGRADAAFVRARTGFAIGGVAPVGHSEPPLVVLDADLRDHDEIWAAAGAPNAVFRLRSADLEAMTGGGFADVRQD